jgi:hypothetical protein
MGEKRNGYRILVGKSEIKKHFEGLSVDVWLAAKRILWKYVGEYGLHSSDSG